eukprot:GGOE01016045.1.p3 GENE.GGOE01016045.1~~GGOE01016045.1.p3  ORF type:complete len:110 (+),score=4.76 GGOE01016045.1:382-711(+)
MLENVLEKESTLMRDPVMCGLLVRLIHRDRLHCPEEKLKASFKTSKAQPLRTAGPGPSPGAARNERLLPSSCTVCTPPCGSIPGTFLCSDNDIIAVSKSCCSFSRLLST